MTRLIYDNIYGIEEYLGCVIKDYVKGNTCKIDGLDIYITRQIVNANPPLQKSYPYPLSNNGYETLISFLNNPNSSKGLYNNLNEIMYYKDYSLDARIVESFNLTVFDYYNSRDGEWALYYIIM